MKYLKLYENLENQTFKEWFKINNPNQSCTEFVDLDCHAENITDLNGIEQFINLKELKCYTNKISNLKPLRNLINLHYLNVHSNDFKNLSGIEKLINLEKLSCGIGKVSSLKGIENLIKLRHFQCSSSGIRNLEEIINLPNLNYVYVDGNDWEYPLPKDFKTKFHICYSHENENYFKTYECQKKFLTKFPERIKDLEPFGIHEKIKEEFADLIEGNEFGFFNLQ